MVAVLLRAARRNRARFVYARVVVRHYLLFFLPAAARFTEYAIATACFTGLPAATSALMLLRKALEDFDLTSGIIYLFWPSWPTL